MCVSASYWLAEHSNDWWTYAVDHGDFFRRNHEGQLDYFINLTHPDYSVKAFARRARLWMDTPGVFVVHFEKIVGERGGGSRTLQIQLLNEPASYLELSLPEGFIESLADTSFGHGHTFRKGSIGQWKEEFTDKQIADFKKNLGEELMLLGYEDDLDWTR